MGAAGLYIASREAIPHDQSPDGRKRRRVLAVGRTRGGSALLQVTARAGDFQATGTRDAAEREGVEVVRQAGYRAWGIHREQREETP
jgi:hypothetical protein